MRDLLFLDRLITSCMIFSISGLQCYFRIVVKPPLPFIWYSPDTKLQPWLSVTSRVTHLKPTLFVKRIHGSENRKSAEKKKKISDGVNDDAEQRKHVEWQRQRDCLHQSAQRQSQTVPFSADGGPGATVCHFLSLSRT